MKNQFVPYEIALQLKEKGFNLNVIATYNQNKELKLFDYELRASSELIAPTHQQSIDWLREKHNLIIEIQLDQTSTVKWAYDITKFNGFMDFERKTNLVEWSLYRDYYEALEYAIKEALTLI